MNDLNVFLYSYTDQKIEDIDTFENDRFCCF